MELEKTILLTKAPVRTFVSDRGFVYFLMRCNAQLVIFNYGLQGNVRCYLILQLIFCCRKLGCKIQENVG